jgi:hypothetical protein
VDTLKRSFRKIRAGGEELEEALYTFLQVYRSTPTCDLDGKSPADIMFGRPLRTISSMLKPSECGTALRDRHKQNDAFNQKHGAVKRGFQQGDLVYAKVYRANSWQWEPGTIIEKIGTVNYNVFLDEQGRLIRSHTNQLKTRFQQPDQEVQQPTTLSIFFDGFGLTIPAAETPEEVPAVVEQPDVAIIEQLDTATVEQLDETVQPEEQEPILENDPDESILTEDYSEDEAGQDDTDQDHQPTEEVAIQPATPLLERGRRMIQLPARFKPYWMMKP